MSARDDYVRMLARIGQVVMASDPAKSLTEAADDLALSEQYRDALRSASVEGVQLSALLVAKLRFEALLNFSARAEASFADDPRAFTDHFRRYHAEVAPSHTFPSEDARRFDAWLARFQAG